MLGIYSSQNTETLDHRLHLPPHREIVPEHIAPLLAFRPAGKQRRRTISNECKEIRNELY